MSEEFRVLLGGAEAPAVGAWAPPTEGTAPEVTSADTAPASPGAAPPPPLDAAGVAAALDLRAIAAGRARPALVLNMIASLDGRAALDGRTGPLANRADYELFHALRGAGDAVMVGAGTVRAEGYGPMDPLAVVVSRSLDLSPDLGLLRCATNRVVVVTDGDGSLEPCAASVSYLRQDRVDLAAALAELRSSFGVEAVVCEGGPRLNDELLRAGLVDELHLVVAPLLAGGADPLTLVHGDAALDPPVRGELVWLLEAGGYLFTRYALRP